MSSQKTAHDENRTPQPATPATRGNPNDHRWKAADNLEKDNEEKSGEHQDPKTDKSGA